MSIRSIVPLFRRRIPRLLRLDSRLGRIEAVSPPLIDRAARFVACEMIEGAYIEFGVFKGNSFIAAYRALHSEFRQRIEQSAGGADPDQNARRQSLVESMKFVALDSFEGLPELTGVDTQTKDFRRGQYRASEDEFRKFIKMGGVDCSKVEIVPGWFSETAKAETWARLGIGKASIVWIDCDLYQSALDALNGVTGLLQEGTVLIFDDWFAFKANPRRGEQRAFAEWRATVREFDFVEFHQEGTWRKSFVAIPKDA
jgi:hypothetical protein